MSFVKSDMSKRIIVRASSAIDCIVMQDNTMGHNNWSIGPFTVKYVLTPAQKNILVKLSSFYTEETIKDILVPLVTQESKVSLRALDWLVTNYSKKHNMACINERKKIFNIHYGYKVALAHFRRRNFDPFRRRLRITVKVEGIEDFDSTVGQVNFMHWAAANGVLKFAEEHIKEIEADMNTVTSESRKRRLNPPNGSARKRNELTHAPDTRCTIYEIGSKVRFDDNDE